MGFLAKRVLHKVVVVLAVLLFIALGGTAAAFNWDDQARSTAVAQWGQVCDGQVGLTSDDLPQPAPPLHTIAMAVFTLQPDGTKTNCWVVYDRTQVARLDYTAYCTFMVHEYGHLGPWANDHSPDPESVMFWKPRNFAGCVAPPVQATRKPKRYPVGCLRQADVNVGYYPYTLQGPAELLTAPHPGAPSRHPLAPGARFAVQSNTNPDHLSDPGQPSPTNGYVWGYAKRGGRSGWVRATALQPDTSGDNWAEGPAGIDFQVGYGVPDEDNPPRFVLGAPVTGTRSVTAQTVYQRHAPNSSPAALLLHGDQVKLLWRSRSYYCVEHEGRRGWVPRSAVESETA